jgi:hypothetical protein
MSYRNNMKSQDTAMVPLEKMNTNSSLASALPPPIQDSDICQDMSKLGNSIKNHAQSYYSNAAKPQEGASAVKASLASLLNNDSPLKRDAMISLLSNPRTVGVAIRFLLAWVIAQHIHPSTPTKTTLLPDELAACIARMDSTANDQGKHISVQI